MTETISRSKVFRDYRIEPGKDYFGLTPAEWGRMWRRHARLEVGNAVFIPAPVPKWGVVVARLHDEVTIVGDLYTYNEACRWARKVRRFSVKIKDGRRPSYAYPPYVKAARA